MQAFEGSCHCGTIRFHLTATVTELTTCDCSLCKMRNALMLKVPEHALTIRQGEHALTLYQWNTRRAKHYFCKHCGTALWLYDPTWPDLVHPHAGAVVGVDGLDVQRLIDAVHLLFDRRGNRLLDRQRIGAGVRRRHECDRHDRPQGRREVRRLGDA